MSEIQELLDKLKKESKNPNSNKNFKGITSKISRIYWNQLQIFKEVGIIPSLSEAFRVSVENYIKEKIELLKKLKR